MKYNREHYDKLMLVISPHHLHILLYHCSTHWSAGSFAVLRSMSEQVAPSRQLHNMWFIVWIGSPHGHSTLEVIPVISNFVPLYFHYNYSS